MIVIIILKVKRIQLVLCAHKGKGGPIKPCRAQEAGGLLRHQQKWTPKNYIQLLLYGVQVGKAKLCKMLRFQKYYGAQERSLVWSCSSPSVERHARLLGGEKQKGKSRKGKEKVEKHRLLVNRFNTVSFSYILYIQSVKLASSCDWEPEWEFAKGHQTTYSAQGQLKQNKKTCTLHPLPNSSHVNEVGKFSVLYNILPWLRI